MNLGIYLIAFPASSETFIVTKLLGLIDAGINVTIFTSMTSTDWDRFANLKTNPDIHKRVVVLPSLRTVPAFWRHGLPSFLKKFCRHPVSFVQLLLHCWQHRHQIPIHFLARAFILSGFLGHSLDILHVEFDFQGLLVADMKFFLNCKLSMSARGSQKRTIIPHKFPDAFRYILSIADGYHTISRYLHAELLDLGLPTYTPVWLIEPAIELRLFNPSLHVKDKEICRTFRILSVARLSWAKGYEFALDAVAILHSKGIDCHYTIVGEGDYRDAIQFAAQQRGLMSAGVVTFIGRVDRESVLKYYNNSDVLLHSSLEEGFANAVLEAQAMGLTVVASDAGGLPENVEDGVTGYIVRRRDPEALAAKLELLATDRELRIKLGAAGINRVRSHFDLADQIAKFVVMYNSIKGE